MKNHFSFVVFLFFLLLCGTAVAQDFQLVYKDGAVEAKSNSGWSDLFIGDSVPSGGVIRLSGDAIAEFSGPGSTLFFSKAGTYNLIPSTVKEEKQDRSTVSSVFSRIARIGSEGDRGKSQVMGVRGAEASDTLGYTWMEGDNLSYDDARDAFGRNDYSLVIDLLEQEVDPQSLNDQGAYWYYLAASYAESNKMGQALRITREHGVENTSPVFNDYLLLKGRLAFEGGDYNEAAHQFDLYTGRVQEASKRQVGSYMLGFSLLRKGDKAGAKVPLEEAVRLNADRDITEMAQQLLQ